MQKRVSPSSGIELPSPPRPVANYVPAVRVGELLFLSGHGPLLPDGSRVNGKLGAEVDVARGQEAARLTGLGLLATLRTELGSLDRVAGIVKVLGLVASRARVRRPARRVERVLRPPRRGAGRGGEALPVRRRRRRAAGGHVHRDRAHREGDRLASVRARSCRG